MNTTAGSGGEQRLQHHGGRGQPSWRSPRSPGGGTGGTAWPQQPAVTLEDAGGNTVTGTAQNVTLAIQNNAGPGGVLSGTADGGGEHHDRVWRRSAGLSINKAGTGYTLTATGSTVNTTPGVVISSAFNIATTAAKLAFGQQPSNGTAGASITPAVTVLIEDANGSTMTNDNSTVTIAIGSNPGSGTLSGTLSVAAVNGVATFSNLSINNAGTGYTLTASDGALTGATSGAFNLAGVATKLAFSQQPGNTSAGASISPAVTVLIEDSSGRTVTTDSSNVTLAIGTNPPGNGTLAGTKTVAAVNGVATFSNLSIDKVGTGYTLTAGDGSLTGATSSGFNLTPGMAAKLAFGQQPTGAAAGASFSPTVTVLCPGRQWEHGEQRHFECNSGAYDQSGQRNIERDHDRGSGKRRGYLQQSLDQQSWKRLRADGQRRRAHKPVQQHLQHHAWHGGTTGVRTAAHQRHGGREYQSGGDGRGPGCQWKHGDG